MAIPTTEGANTAHASGDIFVNALSPVLFLIPEIHASMNTKSATMANMRSQPRPLAVAAASASVITTIPRIWSAGVCVKP
jgi:hypothetical protein